ncbi:MAG: hypothetical protein WCI02_16145 [Planctomycetota bacterium]
MASSDASETRMDTRSIGWFIILIATAMQLARIVGISAVHGELPFLSANDRSRWCAIAALTQDGVWEIDKYQDILDSKGKSKIWYSIDMVKHRGEDGVVHSYSSKPPLLTLMLAAVCKPISLAVGKPLTEEPFLIGRLVLIFVNLVPLFLWWCWFHRWLESHVPNGWTRWILLNASIWGSFMTTFVVTLNNHLHGAIFFSISLALAWQILNDAQSQRTTPWSVWLSVGVSAAMTVACELPALAWAAAIAAILLFADWKRTLIGFGSGSAMIAAAFLLTNIWAHGDWRPPYSHRGLGEEIGLIGTVAEGIYDPGAEPSIDAIRSSIDLTKHPLTEDAQVIPARLDGVLQVIDESNGYRIALKKSERGWMAYRWDDWYDYPKSYWLPGNKKGVDIGEKDPAKYLFHFLIGHHGVFSLTPLWLWSLAGAFFWMRRGPSTLDRDRMDSSSLTGLRAWVLSERGIAAALLAVTLACILFYAVREQVDRNYAGVSSGFRWLFWMIPAWLWLAAPAIQACSKNRWMRSLVLVALVVGVVSATIPWTNPWTHPWPYRMLMWQFPDAFQ